MPAERAPEASAPAIPVRKMDLGPSLERLFRAQEIRLQPLEGGGWRVARRAPLDPEAPIDPESRPPWIIVRVELSGRWQVEGGARMGFGLIGLCRFLGVPDAVAYAAI